MGKKRIDQLMVEQKLVPSREKAQQLIMAGSVYMNGSRVDKAGAFVSSNQVEIRESGIPYVGRGGIKLECALQTFKISLRNKIVLDAGASTGGFTDCLLQHGACKIYAVDVGYGQLAWKLQNDPRVIRIERANIRYLDFNKIGEKVDLITIDLSFISLTLVLSHLLNFLKPCGDMIALIKPQFEVGKGEVGKGGIVREDELHQKAVNKIKVFAEEIGLRTGGVAESPIFGQKGNKEFLIYLKPVFSAALQKG